MQWPLYISALLLFPSERFSSQHHGWEYGSWRKTLRTGLPGRGWWPGPTASGHLVLQWYWNGPHWCWWSSESEERLSRKSKSRTAPGFKVKPQGFLSQDLLCGPRGWRCLQMWRGRGDKISDGLLAGAPEKKVTRQLCASEEASRYVKSGPDTIGLLLDALLCEYRMPSWTRGRSPEVRCQSDHFEVEWSTSKESTQTSWRPESYSWAIKWAMILNTLCTSPLNLSFFNCKIMPSNLTVLKCLLAVLDSLILFAVISNFCPLGILSAENTCINEALCLLVACVCVCFE